MTDWPTRCNQLLSDCSILDVIAIQVANFEQAHGSPPEILVLAKQLKGPLVREVFQRHGAEPSVTIIEPVWIGTIPLFFRPIGDNFLKLTNNRIKKETTL